MERDLNYVRTILLVEDEPLIRMATASMLEDAGYRVLEEIDADGALKMLITHPEIDIVITDVQMPGTMDGLKLVQIIRHAYSGISTIVTSGRASLG